MFIKYLKLKDFRNYNNLELPINKNINIFYGDNAQGKTNILEAIFLCASGRSHRTSKDIDLVKTGEVKYFIKLKIDKDISDTNIEVSFSKEEKKRIKLNEIPVKKIGDLMGNLRVVLFSPEDLLIIKEGPLERRRFVDITLSQIKPSYFYNLQQYNKVLFQRNSLLREMKNRYSLIDTLEIWNNKLIDIGSKIINYRKAFIERLNVLLSNIHGSLTNGSEMLFIKYEPSFQVENYEEISQIKLNFRQALESIKSKEIYRAATLIGPQRDDYVINLNNMNVKSYGSQGQQRTAILSIKLSEIEIMKNETGEYPVLLLDDVMSELDINRQEFLLENLNNIQTFITCTDKDYFVKLKKDLECSFFNVLNGKVLNNG